MRIDKSLISSKRFMFAIACFLQSSALLSAFLVAVTFNDAWLAVIVGSILFIPILFVYRALMLRFPDKTLIGMLEEIFGPVLGKIIGIIYCLYFVTLSALNVKDLGDFVKITVMRETPHIALTITCILVVVFAVRYGLKVVTRYSALFTIAFIVIIITSIAFLFSIIDLKNLLPMFTLPLKKYIHSTHIVTTIPLGETIILLMLTPCIYFSKKTLTKAWFLGIGIGMGSVLLVLLRDLSVLGNTVHLFTLPGLVSMRLVDLGEALNRVEILFAATLMMLLFFKISVLCYCTTIAIAEIFKTKKYKNITLIVGLLIVFYNPLLYPNQVVHAESGQTTTPFSWSLFQFIIPIITLLVAVIRKLPKKPVKEEMDKKQEEEHAWDG